MAALQDLISQISDPILRSRIEQEVNKLSENKKFGLVFEEHIPEVTALYDIPIQPGCLAMLKNNKSDKTIYTVDRIEGDNAVCIDKDIMTEPVIIPVADIVCVAQFGQPIYPYLQEVDSVCNAPDSDSWHTLIEADNYHALQLLAYLYEGKVDCIYIDPPYNTGARDWKYNNDYVDSSDAYRHSKWLSMMEKRLKLAKKLLNPNDSVLIITIDEKEYLHLGCLLEELFPNASMSMITDVINPRAGVARPKSFTRNQEYIYTIQIGNSCVAPEVLEQASSKAPIWFSLMRTGSNSARIDRPNLFYPIWVFPNGELHSVGENIPIDVDKASIVPPQDGLIAVWPLRPDGRENTWQLGRDALSKAFNEGTAKISLHSNKITINYLRSAEKNRIKSGELLVSGKDERGALLIEHNNKAKKTKAPTEVWNKASHDAGIYGSTMINTIFNGKRFTFPKSLYAEYDTISFFIVNKPSALVVDFFAGSGTTLHAINLLNAEDDGHRRCIMVTNNEVSEEEAKSLTAQGLHPGDKEWEQYGIAQYVTWPRTVCSIEGHDINGEPLKGKYISDKDINMSDGFKANAVYFKLGFLDKDSVALGRQFRELLPVFWMKAGCIGPCPSIDSDENLPQTLILPENGFAVLLDHRAYVDFVARVSSDDRIKTVYIVTDSESEYDSMIRELDNKDTYQIYRDYLDNFRINTEDRI